MSTKCLFVSLALLLISAMASARGVDPGLISMLYSTSNTIDQHTNHGSVVDSIFIQIRHRANITNSTLSEADVDRIVRTYVSEKYAPALVANYARLYSQLKAEKSGFTACDELQPFNLTKDVLAALCVESEGSTVRVEYRANGYSKGWSTMATYTFTNDGDAFRLNEVGIFMKEGTKVYIEGL